MIPGSSPLTSPATSISMKTGSRTTRGPRRMLLARQKHVLICVGVCVQGVFKGGR
jgi:hypothetical protein